MLNRYINCKKINDEYIHLIEDIDIFNRLPWGLITYNFLVDSTYGTVRNFIAQKDKTSDRYYTYGTVRNLIGRSDLKWAWNNFVK